jgi:hypothetical protein
MAGAKAASSKACFEPGAPVDASYLDIRDIAYDWINSRGNYCYYAKQLGAKFRT